MLTSNSKKGAPGAQRKVREFLNAEAFEAAARSTGADPSSPEDWASLCNAQAVQWAIREQELTDSLEAHRSAALTAQAQLTTLLLALAAADRDCACLQEVWLAAAEANLSARAALPSTDAEPVPTVQVAELSLCLQLRQMEQLADARDRQASMQQSELERASTGRGVEASEATAVAKAETYPACEARHRDCLHCGGEAQPNDSSTWAEPAAWVERAPAGRRVPLGDSASSRLNTAIEGDASTAHPEAPKSVAMAPELDCLAPAVLCGTEEEVDWPEFGANRSVPGGDAGG